MRLRRTSTDKKVTSCLSISFICLDLTSWAAFAQNFRCPVTEQRKNCKSINRQAGWSLMLALSLLCLFACSEQASAQGFGRIVGNVTDPSGAVIVDAKVTAIQVGKGLSRTATTNSSGYYVLDSLRPAQYDLSVEAAGFHTFDQKGVTLLADQTLTANVNMQVGSAGRGYYQLPHQSSESDRNLRGRVSPGRDQDLSRRGGNRDQRVATEPG